MARPRERPRAARRRLTVHQRWALREAQRVTMIREAVADLGADLSHERLAAATGIPFGYLCWAYPSVSDLRALVAQKADLLRSAPRSPRR